MSKLSFVSLRADHPDKIDTPPDKLYEEIGRPDVITRLYIALLLDIG